MSQSIDTTRLAELCSRIREELGAGRDALDLINDLVENEGATYKTAPTTNTFRLAGVTGTCTWSETTGVIGSWVGNAQKRIKAAGEPGPGHNSRNGDADDRLRLLVERIERLEEEKQGISGDIKDVYNEAKATGYDAKILKQIVRLRKKNPDARREEEAVLETYKAALGID